MAMSTATTTEADGAQQLPCDAWDGVDLAALLAPEPLGADRFDFAHNERNSGGEVFGGQYLGQALAAALATADGRAPHAMHAFFLRAASANRRLTAQVTRVRDGRSFLHRRVELVQDGALVFSAEVSLHDAEANQPAHQARMPEAAPPEALHTVAELHARHGPSVLGALAGDKLQHKQAVLVKPIDQHAGIAGPAASPHCGVWLRALRFAPRDSLQHYAALAYLSDYWSNAACRLTHARTLFDGTLSSLSLNHSIWFQRQPQADAWMLFDLDSPSTHGGTGLNRGNLFARDGRLVAMVAQEGLVRRTRRHA